MENLDRLLTQRVRDYFDIKNHSDYEIIHIDDPRLLLVPERLDVLIKLFYIDCFVRNINIEYATKVYKAHVHSITCFTDKESGQADKDSQQAFVSIFENLIRSFQENGFDSSLSMIPISNENIILDGAHRLACCIYFNKPLDAIKLKYVAHDGLIETPVYDYAFFRKYALIQEYLDLAAFQYLKYSKKNLFLACIWPRAQGGETREHAIELIRGKHPIVYRKDVKLSYKALERLISQIYINDSWVGNAIDNFKGARRKALSCFDPKGIETFILFEGKDTGDTLKLKDDVREIFKVGKHSIHISDNNDESALIANYVFNENSLTFLEYAETGKCPHIVQKMCESNCDGIYDLKTALMIGGVKNLDMSAPVLLSEQDLPENVSIDYILNMPYMTFTYIGKKILFPSTKVYKLLNIPKGEREYFKDRCRILKELEAKIIYKKIYWCERIRYILSVYYYKLRLLISRG